MARTNSARAKRTVFIPVVRQRRAGDPEDQAGELLEIYSTADEAPTPDERARLEGKGLEPTVADLRRSPPLYEAGVAAVAAYRKLSPRAPLWALYQRLRPGSALREQQLRLVNARGPTEGQSAELGLALALFMTASASRVRCVFATGALSRLQHPGELTRNPWRSDDIEIAEVAGLSVKLGLIRDAVKAGKLDALRREGQVLCITPATCAGGCVSDLPEARELVASGVRLIAVTWLSEAVTAIGAQRTRTTRADRWLVSALLLLSLTAIAVRAGAGIVNAPIPLTFHAGATELVAQPYVSCVGGEARPLAVRGPRKLIPTGATLAWQVEIGNGEQARASLLRTWGWPDYHLTHVLLSETSPTKVNSDSAPAAPGETIEFWWDLDATPETMALVVLATRFRSLDGDEVMNALRARFPAHFGPRQEPLDITEAVNFVRQLAPGNLSFVFESRVMPNRC